jgi:RimJ/RimL family protein N-acetyltransferase
MTTHPLYSDLVSQWVGRKVRLREVGPADQRTLIGFDRGDAGKVGGYRHWAAHRSEVAEDGDDVQFAIETRHGGMVVGSCTIQADPRSRRFSYGIGIGPQHRRCGYAGDAIIVLLAYMFGQRGYHRCEVCIYGGNLASLSLHGALGFREQGRQRDTELLSGEIKYPALMGISAAEFAAIHPDFTTVGAPVGARRGRHWRTRRGRHWYPQR